MLFGADPALLTSRTELQPNDYPELGSEITVTGTFELYEEDGYQYCRLVDAEMIE